VADRRGGATETPVPTGEAHLPDAQRDRLLHSTVALVVTNGASVVLGVAFWAVAARLYTERQVGDGAQEIGALIFLGVVAQLNLGTVFPRFLFAAGARAGVLLRAGYSAAMSTALVASVAFLLVTYGRHDYIQGGFWPAAVFVAASVLWVVFTIEDAALIGFRRTFWVPVENTSFSVVKVLLLPVFAVVGARAGVFNSWVLPVLGCTVAINVYLWRRVLPDHVRHATGLGVLPERRILGTFWVAEYLGGLAIGAMASLPVIIVGQRLGASQAAYFQTPWFAGTTFDGLLFSFATALIVEATARPSAAASSVRRSVRLAIWFLGPAVFAIVVGAPWFLRILGPAYAAHGTRLLQLLALALPFMGINVLYVTYARLARRIRRPLVVQVTIAVIVLALCYLLIRPMGIAGAGVAFLAGQGVVALVVLPSVVRQYRRADMSPGFATGSALVVRSRGREPDAPPAEEPEAGPSGPPTTGERRPEPEAAAPNGSSEPPAIGRRAGPVDDASA
jgi:O-antigen/teichoic acid export membrane protein